jgi:hypothetical protein
MLLSANKLKKKENRAPPLLGIHRRRGPLKQSIAETIDGLLLLMRHCKHT